LNLMDYDQVGSSFMFNPFSGLPSAYPKRS
jgi:hypothetical protein